VTLASGSRLGPYEVLAPLGSGGMGEVWKARDTRLERTVAIKVLPERLASSEEIKRRFEREARAIARLSHPHICSLYDVGSEGGTEYLVMEYLEGETLADRLARGALPLDQALRYGMQIADALEKAHRQGIVHRDLKPGNVMLTRSGVKLLDFGLAHAIAPAAPADSLSALATQDKPLTAEGTIVGTVQYMAPEQLEGKSVDARTDIFAFGAVLYEMATGRKAFSGSSQVSIMGEILHKEPPAISTVVAMSPPALDRIVQTCLAKDPDERWQSAGDVGKELAWIGEGPSGAATASGARSQSSSRERVAWVIAALALALAAVAALLPRRSAPREDPMRFRILPPPGYHLLPLVEISPDAHRLLFLFQDESGRNSVWVRSLDSLGMQRLAGTEDARGMFWSPDSREIGFFSDGKLRRMSADGGPVQTVCASGGAFVGAWGPDGTILFEESFGQPLVRVAAAGGIPRSVAALDRAAGEDAHLGPTFLPDGRHFVFLDRNVDMEKTQVCVGSLDSKEVRPLFRSDSSAAYSAPGYLFFSRDNAVLAWRFDPDKLRLIGEPAPVLEHVHVLSSDNVLGLSAAGNRLAYLSWALGRDLVWVDRKGRELGRLGETGGYVDVRISPDGTRIAVSRRDPARAQNLDIWVLDAARGTATRVTADRADEFDPEWFPDGERIAYVTDKNGFYDLAERPAAGGPEKILRRTSEDKLLPSVTPDGRHLLVAIPRAGNYVRVLFPVAGPEDPVPLTPDPRFSEEHPSVSPDGRWSAFESRESGEREVYIEPLPSGAKRQVSVGGGQMAVWNRSGSELFYLSKDGMLMSVSLKLSPGRIEAGDPQPLFPLRVDISGELTWNARPYDVFPDGQKFLVVRRDPAVEPDATVLITNWTALLKTGR
jgi:serine/threonine protein kinase/Tol biopolymer transport system component